MDILKIHFTGIPKKENPDNTVDYKLDYLIDGDIAGLVDMLKDVFVKNDSFRAMAIQAIKETEIGEIQSLQPSKNTGEGIAENRPFKNLTVVSAIMSLPPAIYIGEGDYFSFELKFFVNGPGDIRLVYELRGPSIFINPYLGFKECDWLYLVENIDSDEALISACMETLNFLKINGITWSR